MGKISDEKLILALCAAPTIRGAAKQVGCSESLIYGRLKDPVFKAKYDAERLQVMERYAASLQLLLGSAVGTMAEVNANKMLPAQTRLNAADAIFRNCLKLDERLMTQKRLDALEAAVEALEGKRK